MPDVEIQIPSGNIVVTSYGQITLETCSSLVKMAQYAAQRGITAINWEFTLGNLVDKVRNEAARNLLNGQSQWLWFLDGDMVFAPQIIDAMLYAAFQERKDADIVGGWCQLRNEPYLPTLDTGTGTWEPQVPRQGILEVMRTGGACLLVKRHVFEQLEYPWFGVRPVPRAIDMMAELDNYARQKFDLRNPWAATPEWEALLDCARQDAGSTTAGEFGSVGEDSSFCDKAKAAGFTIVVQTGAICGHVTHRLLQPSDHAEAMKKIHKSQRAASGITV